MVLVSSKPWSGTSSTIGCCKWMHFPDERAEVANMISDLGLRNLIAVAGDAHMVAFDDGSNTDYSVDRFFGAGFPLFQSAPLDKEGSFKGGPYSLGCHINEKQIALRGQLIKFLTWGHVF